MNPTVAGSTLFFNADDGIHGDELWKTDGTASGTVMVKDIRTREPDYGVSQMIAFGNTLYFTVADNSHGHELWKSDGTEIGTVMVKDIRSDSTPSIHISLGVVIGNSLYFTADDRLIRGKVMEQKH